MILLSFYIFFFVLVIVIGAMAAYSDVRGLVIANWYSGAVIGLFFACYIVMYVSGRADVFAPIWLHFLASFIVFIVTLLMFLGGGLGAADSKLGSAFALWTGMGGLFSFLFYMALIGGLVGLFALFVQKKKPFKSPVEGGWIARVQAGESKVPYGVAIFGGAVISFFTSGYFSPVVLTSFL